MGSKIYWRPKYTGTDLEAEVQSSFWDDLGNALGQSQQMEIRILAAQRPVIAAMVGLFPTEPAWGRLLTALETHDTIIVERRW